MEKAFEHKGFIGSIDFSLEDNVLHGKLLYINGLITYEAESLPALRQAFIEAVEDYIADCKELGTEMLKSFNGKFNVRIPPELHKEVAFLAAKQGITLNAVIHKAIENEIKHYQ